MRDIAPDLASRPPDDSISSDNPNSRYATGEVMAFPLPLSQISLNSFSLRPLLPLSSKYLLSLAIV